VLKCLLAQCTHCSFQMLNSKCVNMWYHCSCPYRLQRAFCLGTTL
jgi:hypothetical protein